MPSDSSTTIDAVYVILSAALRVPVAALCHTALDTKFVRTGMDISLMAKTAVTPNRKLGNENIGTRTKVLAHHATFFSDLFLRTCRV
jgi:hypothetical protein